MDAKTLSELYKLNKKSISYKDYFKGQVTIDYLPLGVYDSEENSLVIDDYPYGYLRTKIRYWIETTNKGDRFVYQTLNPKTNKWNTPKKSTYSSVKVLVAYANGHIHSLALNMNDDVSKADAFLNSFKNLSDKQKARIHQVKGWSKAMEHVTFSCTTQRYRHKVTGEIETSLDIFKLKEYEKIDEFGNVIDEEKEQRERENSRIAINKTAAAYANISLREAKQNET